MPKIHHGAYQSYVTRSDTKQPDNRPAKRLPESIINPSEKKHLACRGIFSPFIFVIQSKLLYDIICITLVLQFNSQSNKGLYMITPKEKNRIQVNLRISNSLHDSLLSESDHYCCSLSELIREILSAHKSNVPSKEKRQSAPLPDNVIKEVFEFWKTTLNHPRSNLDDKRKALIRKNLKSGYSVDDLKSAITGCANTPHNMGDNDRGQKYDSIELILRDSGQIDRFMNNSVSRPISRTQSSSLTNNNVAAAKAFMETSK